MPGQVFIASVCTSPAVLRIFPIIRNCVSTSPAWSKSELKLAVPLAWQDLHVEHLQGEDRVLSAQGRQKVRAQLGRENVVQVRWHQDVPPTRAFRAAATNLEVQEAYLWDLRPSNFSLTGLHQLQRDQGHAWARCSSCFPTATRCVPSIWATPPHRAARIKKWHFAGGRDNMRLLQIELAQNVTGKFQIVLGLVPRLASDAAMVRLRLPVVLGRNDKNQGMLAYRIDGWQTADTKENLVIDPVAGERFVKLWQESGQANPGLPTRAYNFRRDGDFAALRVALQPLRPTADEEISFHVHPTFTDVAVRLQIQGTGADVSFLECEVPAQMSLADVEVDQSVDRGPWPVNRDENEARSTVHGPRSRSSVRWSRSDQTVQIWLPRPVREADIVLSGWFKNPSPHIQKGEQAVRFVLPRIRPLQMRVPSCVVKFQTDAGYELKPENLQGLIARKEPLTFELSKDREFFTGAVLLHAAAVRPEVRMLTKAGMSGGVLAFSTHIDCRLPRPLIRPFAQPTPAGARDEKIVLKLRNWPADVELDPGQAESRKEYRRVGNDHLWQFVLPAGQVWPISFDVRGQTNLGPGQKIDVPVLEVENADQREQVLAATGVNSTSVVARGLTAVKDLPHALRFWPAELSRMSNEFLAWTVAAVPWTVNREPRSVDQKANANGPRSTVHGARSTTPAWQLQIQAPLSVSRAGKRHVLWVQHNIFEQNGRWLHQASYLLTVQSPGEMQVVLPAGACLLAASLGRAVSSATLGRRSAPDTQPAPGPGGPGLAAALAVSAGPWTVDREP